VRIVEGWVYVKDIPSHDEYGRPNIPKAMNEWGRRPLQRATTS